MQTLLEQWRNPWVRDLVLSIVWLASVFVVRTAALRMVRHKSWPSDTISLRLTAQVRRTAWLLAAFGLLLLWATELRTMALSLMALGVASVIATKELLLCVMGSLLRASAGAYTVGDRVYIGSAHGDVIDYGLFATTLLEVGPGHRWTGRTLTVPNSMLFSGPVSNETHSGEYVLHMIVIPETADADLDGIEELLLGVAEEISAEYREAAAADLTEQASTLGHAPPVLTPRVIVQVPDAGKVSLLLRLPVPADKKDDIEQRVLRAYLAARPRAAPKHTTDLSAPPG